MLYLCGSSRAELSYAAYEQRDRDITLYTLDLPPAERARVQAFAENNILPENRSYWYHHFRDNCATRIRDILDLATDGQFKAAYGEAPGRYTLRQHVRRHSWFNPLGDWALSFWMGRNIDRPITVWEEMFLPSEVGKRAEGFRYTDAQGEEYALVREVEYRNRAVNRPAVLDVPRKQWPRELLFSLVFFFLILSFRISRRPVLRRILGLLQAAAGAFFGFAGLLLLFLSFFTNHDYTYHNTNLLYVNPLLFLAVPWGIRTALGNRAFGSSAKSSIPVAGERLKALWTAVFFAGLFTQALNLITPIFQANQVSAALILPLAAALSYLPQWIAPNLFLDSPKGSRRRSSRNFVILLVPLLFLSPPAEAQTITDEADAAPPRPYVPLVGTRSPADSAAGRAGEGRGSLETALPQEGALLVEGQLSQQEAPSMEETFPPASILALLSAAVEEPVWRPDWPAEFPPDGFRGSPLPRSITLSGPQGEWRLRRSAFGPFEEFPRFLVPFNIPGGSFDHVLTRFDPAGNITGFTLAGEHPLDIEFIEIGEGRITARILLDEKAFFVLLQQGAREDTELWYDPWGRALASLRCFRRPEGLRAVRFRRDRSLTEAAYHINSAGAISAIDYRLQSPSGVPDQGDLDFTAFFHILYTAAGYPRYWERRPLPEAPPREEGLSLMPDPALSESPVPPILGWSFTFRWDQDGRLCGLSGRSVPEGLAEEEWLYAYVLDSRGNWTERTELSLVLGQGLGYARNSGIIRRSIEY
jgi:hypothetical protein